MSTTASNAYASEKKLADDAYIQETQRPKDTSRPVKNFVIIVAVMAAFGGLMFGYDIGGSGGTLVMPAFRDHFDWPPSSCCEAGVTSTSGPDYCMRFGCAEEERSCIATGTEYEGRVLTQCEEDTWEYNPGYVSDAQGWISMLFTIGCFCGAITSSWQAEYLGRKKTLMLHDVVFTIGATMQMASPSIGVMYAGRFIGGMGVGTLSMCVPLYQSELAPEHIRGKLVSLQQLCITLGIVIAALLNVFLKNSEIGWRFSYGGNIVFSIIMFVAMFGLPESPRWLAAHGKMNEARNVLGKVRYSDEVDDEMQTIVNQIELEKEIGSGTWGQVFGKANHMRYRTLLGAALQFFQQWTGINAIMFFAPDILNTFFSEDAALWGNMGIMFFNFIATFICIWLIDRTGRVVLLTIGGMGMMIGLAGCAFLASPVFDYQNDQTIGVLILIFCIIYVGCFAFSWGPIIWVACSELFPQNLRSKCMSVSTASNWAMAAVVGKVTPYMYKDTGLHLYGTFLLFLSMVVIMSFFIYACLPETASVSLEETDQLFAEFKPGFSRRATSVNHRKTWLN